MTAFEAEHGHPNRSDHLNRLVANTAFTQFQAEFIESSREGSIVWYKGTPYHLDKLVAGQAAGSVWGADGTRSEFDGGQ